MLMIVTKAWGILFTMGNRLLQFYLELKVTERLDADLGGVLKFA